MPKVGLGYVKVQRHRGRRIYTLEIGNLNVTVWMDEKNEVNLLNVHNINRRPLRVSRPETLPNSCIWIE